PVFSPDGKRLAVGHHGHISVFDLAGGKRTRVTSPPWLTFAPAWSTDGRQLTYFSWHERSTGGVYRRASDGTGPEEKSVRESARSQRDHQGLVTRRTLGFLRLGRCHVHPPTHRRAQGHRIGARGFQKAAPTLLSE